MKIPSASLAISTLALAVALTGTAGAVVLINGSQIKNHTITANKLAKGVLYPGVAGPKGDTGAQGNAGRDGDPGAAGPAGQDRLAASVQVIDPASATGSGRGVALLERGGTASTAPTCIQPTQSVDVASAAIIVTPAPTGVGLYSAQIVRSDPACPHANEIGVYTINLGGGSPVVNAISFSIVAP